MISFVLAIVLIFSCLPNLNAEATSDTVDETRGIFIDVFEYKNSSPDGASLGSIMSYIDSTIGFMGENNMNTIYFKSVEKMSTSYKSDSMDYFILDNVSGDSGDLLRYTIDKASEYGIDVVALINTWSLPDEYSGEYGIKYDGKFYANIALQEGRIYSPIIEVMENYNIDVVIDGNFYPDGDFDDSEYYKKSSKKKTLDEFRIENINQYIKGLSEAMSASNYTNRIGIITPPSAYSKGVSNDSKYKNYCSVPLWIESNWIDFVMPILDMEMNAVGETTDYMYYADKWYNLSSATNSRWIPILSSKKMISGGYKDKSELGIQMFYAFNSGAAGVAFDSAQLFLSDNEKYKESIERVTDFFYDGDGPKDTVDKDFIITRPSKDITVTSQYYYIMGICDPKLPIYCNDEKVDYRGDVGTFGHYVKLSSGDNKFEFYQEGIGTKSVTITYDPPKEAGIQYIDKITQKTMDPMVQDIAYVGEEYTLECIAPSGGEVIAEVAGHNVILEQVKTADHGVAAVYRGKYTIPDILESNHIKMIGKVKYTLIFDGEETEYESNGDLYVAYSGNKIRVKARDFMTNVYETSSINYQYASVMNIGTEDVVLGQTTQMFHLSQGGYVKKSDVDILYEANEPNDRVNNIRYVTSYDSEKLVFEGAKNSAYKINSDGNITVSLYNIVGVSQKNNVFNLIKRHSKLFSDVIVTENDESVSMEFILKPDVQVWGYSFDHSGNNGVLYFQKKPKLADDDKMPLKGITIVLDPGHGGSDPGAAGPPQEYGPVEKDVTLMTALETKKSLEDMGARVLITRTSDYSMDLYQRAAITDKVKPDAFISIHLNSVAETSDGGKADGIEIYYANSSSYNLGDNIINCISSYTGRAKRDVINGVYVVARPTSSPSVLCEIGFMPNPEQYDDMINKTVISRTGYAIAKAVEESLK